MGEFRKYDVLSTEIVGGEIRCKLGDSATNTGYVDDCPFWGLDGFYSRPSDPDDDGACMAIFAQEGSTKRIVATKDNRIVTLYGDIQPGDRAIVSQNGTCVLVKANGTVNIVTFNQTQNDALMMVDVSGEDGRITQMVGGTAQTSLIQQSCDEIKMAAGGSTFLLNSSGCSISGNWFSCNTAGGNLGMTAPGVAPIAPVNSILLGVMGQSGMPSTFWTVAS